MDRVRDVGVGDGGVQGSGFRVQGSGFRVQGSGCRVQGSGFRVQGSGFRVWGVGTESAMLASVMEVSAMVMVKVASHRGSESV